MEEAGFDALVTTDKGLPRQQNLARFALAVVVLRGESNRLEHLAPLVEGRLQGIREAPAKGVTYLT